jgi:hypothetical protein
VQHELSLNSEALLTVLHHKTIMPCEVAFGETEVMHCIQKIGFTYSIRAADADDPLGKTKLLVRIVFELEN